MNLMIVGAPAYGLKEKTAKRRQLMNLTLVEAPARRRKAKTAKQQKNQFMHLRLVKAPGRGRKAKIAEQRQLANLTLVEAPDWESWDAVKSYICQITVIMAMERLGRRDVSTTHDEYLRRLLPIMEVEFHHMRQAFKCFEWSIVFQ